MLTPAFPSVDGNVLNASSCDATIGQMSSTKCRRPTAHEKLFEADAARTPPYMAFEYTDLNGSS